MLDEKKVEMFINEHLISYHSVPPEVFFYGPESILPVISVDKLRAEIESGRLDKKFDLSIPAEESAIEEILAMGKKIKGLAASSLEIVGKLLRGETLAPPAKIKEEKAFGKLGEKPQNSKIAKRKIESNLRGINSPFHRK